MKKGLFAVVMAVTLSALSAFSSMAASGINTNEEALLKEFEAGVDTKADLLGAEIVTQWKAEAANALVQVDLDASACSALSQGIKDAVATVAPITTRRGLKNASGDVVKAVNAISQNYGMTVTLSDNGYAKVTIKTESGQTTTVGDNKKAVNQTGFGLLQTVVSLGAAILVLGGALLVYRRRRMFAA